MFFFFVVLQAALYLCLARGVDVLLQHTVKRKSHGDDKGKCAWWSEVGDAVSCLGVT